jgi:hypothetical protein
MPTDRQILAIESYCRSARRSVPQLCDEVSGGRTHTIGKLTSGEVSEILGELHQNAIIDRAAYEMDEEFYSQKRSSENGQGKITEDQHRPTLDVAQHPKTRIAI